MKILFSSISITLIFILFYGLRLDYPPYPYFDEIRCVPAEKSLLDRSGYTLRDHPPLGQFSNALGIKFLGDNPWGWRLPSLIFGGVSTALAAYLAFLFSGNWRLFWLTGGLLFVDGLWITLARVGIFSAIEVFFILLTLVCWRLGQLQDARRKIYWIAAWASAGLAMACKWQGGLVVLIPVLYYLIMPSEKSQGLRRWGFGFFLMIAAYMACFLLVPYIHGLQWSDIFSLQLKIPLHAFHYAANRYESSWYTWIFLWRPIWFGFLPHANQTVDGIICIGNPFVFALIIPSMIWLAVCFRDRKNPLALLVLIGFLVFWIPSSLLGTRAMFYQFYPALPFVALGIAAMMEHLWQQHKLWLRILAVSCLGLILLGYVFFLPLWTGMPISMAFFQQHMWLPSWI